MKSGGLLLAAVATANADAADAVDDRRDDARPDVTTTPALLDICCPSVNWNELLGVDKPVTSVWNELRGVVLELLIPAALCARESDTTVSLLPLFPLETLTLR